MRLPKRFTIFCDGAYSRKFGVYGYAAALFGPAGDLISVTAQRLNTSQVAVRDIRMSRLTGNEADYDTYIPGEAVIDLPPGILATSNTAEVAAISLGLHVGRAAQTQAHNLKYGDFAVDIWADSTYAIGLHEKRYRATTIPNDIAITNALWGRADPRSLAEVTFNHCRGHRGEFGNELVDKVASAFMRDNLDETWDPHWDQIRKDSGLIPPHRLGAKTLSGPADADGGSLLPGIDVAFCYYEVAANPTILALDNWLSLRTDLDFHSLHTVGHLRVDGKGENAYMANRIAEAYATLEELCPTASALYREFRVKFEVDQKAIIKRYVNAFANGHRGGWSKVNCVDWPQQKEPYSKNVGRGHQ